MTILDRPLRVDSLRSAVRAALRARERQYEVRDHLREREERERKLEETDRIKNEFLAMLAHELRNPLAPIRHAVEILRDAEQETAVRDRALLILDRQVAQLSRLVDDMVDVARITRGRIELRKTDVDLAEIAARALEAADPLFAARGHHLTRALSAAPTRADAARLEQMIANLLSNAARYTPPGGCVQVTTLRVGDRVEIRVQDDGVGIAPEVLPRVFDMFAQGARGPDRANGGLGLGLSVVKLLAQKHGGTVSARSAGRGRGSEFVIALPAAPSAADPASGGGSPASPLCYRSALVVDDNPDAAESLAALLQRDGLEVRVAFDGEDALRAADRAWPQLVILDIGLPGLDGYEVARRLRRMQRDRPLAIVALSGYGSAEDRRRSTDAGFDGHFVKPIARESLQRMLRGG